MRMKRAPNEKECRLLGRSHNNTSSRSSRCSGSKVARLRQPIMARAKDSRKVENKKEKNQRPHLGHNNFGAVTPAAPDEKLRSRFCNAVSCRASVSEANSIFANGSAFHKKRPTIAACFYSNSAI
jgi:hypothetical protein